VGKFLKVSLSILISAGLLVFLIIKIDLSLVYENLVLFDSYIFYILIFIYFTSLIARTFRWQKLIEQREKIEFKLVLKALLYGFMINNLLPAKLGELARMEYLKRKKNINRGYLLGTIFAERLLDILIVLIILLISIVFSETIRIILADNGHLFIGVIVGISLITYFLLKPALIIKTLSYFPDKISYRIEQILNSLKDSFNFIYRSRILISFSLLSIFIWALTLVTSFLILQGLEIFLPLYALFFIVAASVFSFIIPSTSGGIGVYHAISTGALILFNIAPEKAFAYAIDRKSTRLNSSHT